LGLEGGETAEQEDGKHQVSHVRKL
jgi:hypothetical protein